MPDEEAIKLRETWANMQAGIGVYVNMGDREPVYIAMSVPPKKEDFASAILFLQLLQEKAE